MKKNRCLNLKDQSIINKPFLAPINNFKFKYNNFPKFSRRQFEFLYHKDITRNKRFIPYRESLSGIDPYNQYDQFFRKGIIQPMQRPSIFEKLEPVNLKCQTERIKKWALGTTYECPSYEMLPKKQQYTNYYFPQKNIENQKQCFSHNNITGLRIPKLKRNHSQISFLKMKGETSNNTESKGNDYMHSAIKLSSITNVSSKDYDIINFTKLDSTRKIKPQIYNKCFYFKKKIMGEYINLMNISNINYNKEYPIKLRENPKRFFKYNGIFSNIIDTLVKNGRK